MLEALILTAVVVVSLTAYTYWAAKQGHDFSFLGPILFTSIIILLLFGFIQVLLEAPYPLLVYLDYIASVPGVSCPGVHESQGILVMLKLS